MKYCANCNRNYFDTLESCPYCGATLCSSFDIGNSVAHDENVADSDVLYNSTMSDSLQNNSMSNNSAYLLFKTIKQICESDKIISNVKKYSFFKSLSDFKALSDKNKDLFPHHQYVEISESQSGSKLLIIKKPVFLDCPVPPASIRSYIVDGYNNISSKVLVKPDYLDFIEKNSFNLSVYEEWLQKRQQWIEETLFLKEVNSLYKSFYSIFSEMKIGSDDKELLFGFGMFYDTRNSEICRPLFVKRLKIDFSDVNADGFKLYIDDDADLRYESDFFGLLGDDVKFTPVAQMEQCLETSTCSDVCNIIECSDFLYSFVNNLSDSVVFSDDNASLSDIHRFIVKYEPCIFYRKKTIGLVGFLDKTLDCIENNSKDIPDFISSVLNFNFQVVSSSGSRNSKDDTVGVRLSKVCGQDFDVLFTKPANKEQLDIALDVEDNSAVQIQGPPGTGKTHTIANLIGHFLAQGKTILVTSEKKKALTVLKDKLDDRIQSLCIPVFDDNKKEIGSVVDAISNECGSFSNLSDVASDIRVLQQKRTFCVDQLNQLRKEIFALTHKRESVFVLNGQSYSLSDISEFVDEHKDYLLNIPDSVDSPDSLPLPVEDIGKLYSFNKLLSAFEQKELAKNLVDYNNFITPVRFRSFVTDNQVVLNDVDSSYAEDFVNGILHFNGVPLFNHPTLQSIRDLSDFVSSIPHYCSWELQIINDGYAEGVYRQRWLDLIDSINSYVVSYEKHLAYVYGHEILGFDEINDVSFISTIFKIRQELKDSGELSFFFKLKDSNVRKVLKFVRIDGKELGSVDSCNCILSFFDCAKKEDSLQRKWNQLFSNTDMSSYDQISKNKEQFLKNVALKIAKYLSWNKDRLQPCLSLMSSAGFNVNSLACFSSLNSSPSDMIFEIVRVLPLHLKRAKHFFDTINFNHEIAVILNAFKNRDVANSILIDNLVSAVKSYNPDAYEKAYDDYRQVYDKYPIFRDYWDNLNVLEKYAPLWAGSIKKKNIEFDDSLIPFDFVLSWKTMRLNKILTDVLQESYEYKENRIRKYTEELFDITSQLVYKSAWYHLIKRFNANPAIFHSLKIWKQYNSKIGRGTGKNVLQYRLAASHELKNARKAIPVWVTTVDRAVDMFEPGDSFDVVIVDEASQSSLEAFAVSFLGKKIIVVGDDKQVSPVLVGANIDLRNSILQQNLSGVTDNWILFNGKTSFYNLIGLVCKPRMLKEHFRCVPEIIQYSNSQFYDNLMKPLRALDDSLLKPALVPIRVDGVRHATKKINEIEALYVISLLKACMSLPEYNGKSFGVISLLGKEQANYINSLLPSYLDSMKVIEDRKIICGDSASFQGDERDVIILTLVNDNDTIHNTYSGANDGAYDKRYNVALSRAKDQVFVVHSFDYKNGKLSDESLQFQLMNYVYNYSVYMDALAKNEVKADSPFEKEVAEYLILKGYKIEQQYQVGSYFIDIAVFSKNLSMPIAVECDGERWHRTDEQIENDLKRQFILERLGWKFVRIRGGDYYKNKEQTMLSVSSKLLELGVYPTTDSHSISTHDSDLLERIKIGMNSEFNFIVHKRDNLPLANLPGDSEFNPFDSFEQNFDDDNDDDSSLHSGSDSLGNDNSFSDGSGSQKFDSYTHNTYRDFKGFLSRKDFYHSSDNLGSSDGSEDISSLFNADGTIGGFRLG